MLFKEDEAARAEAMAVRNNAAWYRWTHDLVDVEGPDADKFVDYLFVNNIAKAAVGKSKYTTMLNEDGKIIDDVIVMHMGENHYWISTLYAPQFLKWAAAHDEGFDVTCRDVTAEWDMVAIQGPNSLELVDAVLDEPVDELKRFSVVDRRIGAADVKVHRAGFTGEMGFEFYIPTEHTADVEALLASEGAKRDMPELQILEVYVRSIPVEKGFALRQDMYGLTPFECDLGWSVCMDKDFVGKEALERAMERGPEKKLVGLRFERPSTEDISQTEIVYRKGVPCGIVRTAIYGYTVDDNIGFAVIDAKKAIPGERVTVGMNDSPAVICDKVFV